jgi:hypothetical protein
MRKELTEKLIEKAPWMFALMDRQKTMKERGCYYPIVFGFECGDGWYDLLAELMDELVKIDVNKELVIFQVKEKFAGLRVYIETYPDDTYEQIKELIGKAEEKSYKTCEACGVEGKLRKGGWLSTLCDECHGINEKGRAGCVVSMQLQGENV